MHSSGSAASQTVVYLLFAVAGSSAQGQTPRWATQDVSQAGEKTPAAASAKADLTKTSDELFKQAAELIEKDQFSAAVERLRKAVALTPNQARVHHYLGYALWKLGQTGPATTEFERALRLEPQNTYTRYFLGRIAYSQDRVDQAIKFFESVLATGEPVFDTYQRLGQAYLRKGEPAKAQDMLHQALEQTPWDGAIHYQLAKIYRQTGRQEEAQRELETAERLKRSDRASIEKLLQLSEAVHNHQLDRTLTLREEVLGQPSKDPEILLWLGILLGQGNLYQEALEPLRLAVVKAPTSFEAHYNLGLTLVRLGQTPEGESSLKKALELSPGSFEANSILAVLYANQTRNQEAIERLRAANQVRPGNLKVLALLGQQYLEGRYLDEAIQTLHKAVRLSPADPKLRYLLVEAYEKNQEFDKALSEAREAVKLFPSEARAHFEVGRETANLGQYQDARAYFEQAIRIDASFAEAYNSLGDAQSRKGEYEAALEQFQKAKNLEPQNLAALRGIGHNLILLKRYQQALSELERAVQVHPDDAQLFFELSQAHARLGNREKASEAVATFQRLRVKESEKQDLERKRHYEAGTAAAVPQP